MIIEVLRHDLSSDRYEQLTQASRLSWDIETSGLDWRTDSIGTCQLTDGSVTVIVQLDGRRPMHLANLIQSPKVQKVFHHAMFDLRFMAYAWTVTPVNIACTKIASKILDHGSAVETHSLQSLLHTKLGVAISKDQQRSDWLKSNLSSEQLAYAASDVTYLGDLLDVLMRELEGKRLIGLALASFEYIPTRVKLDIEGAGDVFTY